MQNVLISCVEKLRGLLLKCQDYKRNLILVIVALALLLDNMLLTCVVPILPRFLIDLRRKDGTLQIGGGSHHPHQTLAPNISSLEHLNFTEFPMHTTPHGELNRQYGMASGYGTDMIMNREGERENCVCKCDDSNSYTVGIAQLKNRKKRSSDDNQDEELEMNSTEYQQILIRENSELGTLYASKPFVQLITNPFIGPLTHRVGYSLPMFVGFIILFVSTIIFAFGNTYWVLFVARSLQGIGSACSSVSGMGMLAEQYPNDEERGNAMGLALGGLALGVMIGPPFGGFMSEYVGKAAPFLLLAFLALGDGLLQLTVLQPKIAPRDEKAPTLKELIQDPYILVTAGAITFANMGIGMLEPTLPLHMMGIMNSSDFEQGVAFLPASIAYLIGTNLFGFLGNVIGRSLSSFLGLIISGISLLCIPSATNFGGLVLPMAGLGFAIGMVDSSMMPTLAQLVDLRHSSVYGSVYAIGDVAFCLGFFIGPIATSSLIQNIGFGGMMYGMAIVNFLYAPLMYFLKNPPARIIEEETNLVKDQMNTTNYVNFSNDEE